MSTSKRKSCSLPKNGKGYTARGTKGGKKGSYGKKSPKKGY